MALMLTRRDEQDAVTITAVGVVDPSTAPALQHAIAVALAEVPTATTIMVDMSGVSLLDSAGISALLRGRRFADAAGRTFRVVGAVGLVREVLQLTGVWQHLTGEPA